jgi:ketosteroid isomerase-like protein
MSEENVELVRRVFEANARGDAVGVLALYDPAVEWDISRAPARDVLGEPHVFHGHNGLREFFRAWYEAWGHIEPDLEDLIDAGEHVVSVETTRGRGRASGAEVELPHAAIWTVRNGRIIRVVWFGTRAEALEAAGQSG